VPRLRCQRSFATSMASLMRSGRGRKNSKASGGDETHMLMARALPATYLAPE
jgi:hypothetical protein